jgi:hypothetical protein
MKTDKPPETALEELLRRTPGVDPAVLAQARQAAEMLQKLGLLTTEPTEAFRPFTRRPHTSAKPPSVGNWKTQQSVQFNQVS